MTSPARSSKTPFFIAVLGLAALNGWFGWEYWARREQAQDAEAQLAAVSNLAQKIEKLKSAPLQVNEGAQSTSALAQLVESKVKSVNLKPEQIAHIVPGEPRRIGETPYLEQATDVELRQASLKSIVEFTIALGQSGPGIAVPSLSLRVPPGTENASGEELWNAQLTLTSRIYAPKIPAPSLSNSPVP